MDATSDGGDAVSLCEVTSFFGTGAWDPWAAWALRSCGASSCLLFSLEAFVVLAASDRSFFLVNALGETRQLPGSVNPLPDKGEASSGVDGLLC